MKDKLFTTKTLVILITILLLLINGISFSPIKRYSADLGKVFRILFWDLQYRNKAAENYQLLFS